MILNRGLIILVLLFAAPALADYEAAYSEEQGCRVVDICTGDEAGDGDCEQISGGDIIVFKPPADRPVIHLWADASPATTFSCQLFGSSVGHDAAVAVTQFTTTAVTETQRIVTIVGPIGTFWARCLSVTGSPHTMTAWFCPGS